MRRTAIVQVYLQTQKPPWGWYIRTTLGKVFLSPDLAERVERSNRTISLTLISETPKKRNKAYTVAVPFYTDDVEIVNIDQNQVLYTR